MLEENFGDVQATATTNAGLQLYDASDLDLAISLARNNWVRQRVQPKMSVASRVTSGSGSRPIAIPS
jgi:hypothetical protein